MPPPQAIVCHLCNGKYFKRSWPIHLKQCEEKWKKTHSRCEYCGTAVAKDDWQDHRVHCKPDRKKKIALDTKNVPLEAPKAADNDSLSAQMSTAVIECEECEAEQAMWQCVQCEQKLCAMCDVELHKKGARARHRRNPLNAKALLNVVNTDCDGNLLVPTFEPEKDQRAECKFCGRRFNPDRVEKHMRICSKAEKKWQKRKAYDGAAKRIEGTDFKQWEHNRAATPEKLKEWRKHGRRWKEESAQIRGAAGVSTLDLETKIIVPCLAKAKAALAAEEEFQKAKEDPNRVFKKALETRVSLAPNKCTKWDSPPDSDRSSKGTKDSAKSSTKNSARSTGRSARISAKSLNVSSAKSSARGSAKSSNVSSAKSSARGSGATVPRNRRPKKSIKEPAIPKVRGQRSRPSSNTNSEPSEGSFGSRSSARSHGSRSSRISARQNAKKAVNPKEVNLSTTGSSVRGQRRKANDTTANAKKPRVPKYGRKPSTTNVRETKNAQPKSAQERADERSAARAKKRGARNPPPKSKFGSNKRKTTKERDAANVAMAIQKSFESTASKPTSSAPKPQPKAVAYEVPKQKKRTDSEVPTELMSRLQIRKEQGQQGQQKREKSEKIETHTSINKLGGSTTVNPAGSKAMKSKRAAYFESLLKNQTDVGSSKAPKENVRKAAVQKENDSRTQQPASRVSRTKSSPIGKSGRGIELGANVKKINEGDAPKDMGDYMARERARRAQRSKGANK